jgi:uncharacterized protein YuzE
VGEREMKVHYYSDTDTLYLDLSDAESEDTIECTRDMVIDLDGDGKPVGIEIEHASEMVELSKISTKGLEIAVEPELVYLP